MLNLSTNLDVVWKKPGYLSSAFGLRQVAWFFQTTSRLVDRFIPFYEDRKHMSRKSHFTKRRSTHPWETILQGGEAHIRKNPFSEKKKLTSGRSTQKGKSPSTKTRSTRPGKAILQREEAHIHEKPFSKEKKHTSGRSHSPKRRSSRT